MESHAVISHEVLASYAADAALAVKGVDRLVDGGIEHWAEHTLDAPGTVRRDESGCGVYFRSPERHLLEVLTHR